MRGKYRPIRTAEKRAMLEAAGDPWPVCECHGLPKVWEARSTRPAGGTWKPRCSRRSAWNRSAQSEKGRISARAAEARYAKSEKGRARRDRYDEGHFRLRVGGISLGTYKATTEQRERIREFTNHQKEARHGRVD